MGHKLNEMATKQQFYELSKTHNLQNPAIPTSFGLAQNGANQGAGSTFPIKFPIDTPATSGTIQLDLGAAHAHYHKISITADNTLIQFKNLTRFRSIIFTLDITINTATFASISYDPNLSNLPSGLPTANGSRYRLLVEGLKTDTEELYYVHGGIGGGAGNQTPWLQDVDADGYDLLDLGNILQFRDGHSFTTDADSLTLDIYTSNPTGIFRITIDENGSGSITEYEFGSGALDIKGNNFANVDTILFTNPVTSIGSISSGLEFRIGDTKDYSLWINSVELYTFNQGSLNIHGLNIAEVDTILFTNPVTTIASISSGLEFRIGDTKDYALFINSVEEYNFNQTQFAIGTNIILMNTDQKLYGDGSGVVLTSAGSQSVTLATGGGTPRLFATDTDIEIVNADMKMNGNALFLDADDDTKIQVGTDDTFQITIGGVVPAVYFSMTQASTVLSNVLIMGDDIDINGNQILNTGTLTLPTSTGTLLSTGEAWVMGDGIKAVFNPNATVAGLNVGEHTADPSTPVNGDIVYNGTTEKFRFRQNGAWVELGGGSQTPWLSNIDADNFSLQDFGNLEYTSTGKTLPADTVTYIGYDGVDLVLNVRDNAGSSLESIDLMTLGSLRFTVANSLVQSISFDITGDLDVHTTVPLVSIYDSSTGSADAVISAIRLQGQDSGGSGPFEFARIQTVQRNVTNGIEAGEIEFLIANTGTEAATAATLMSWGYTESDAIPMLLMQSDNQIIQQKIYRAGGGTGSIADINFFSGSNIFYASITADVQNSSNQEGELSLWVRRNGSGSLEDLVVLNGQTGLKLGNGSSSSAWDYIGFYGSTPVQKPTITGSRGGNAALADLLTKLATMGLIVDSTSA